MSSTIKATRPGVYLRELYLENVKCFGTQQCIEFCKDGKPSNWTVIVGENGVGKTTVLRAIAALCPDPFRGLKGGGDEHGKSGGAWLPPEWNPTRGDERLRDAGDDLGYSYVKLKGDYQSAGGASKACIVETASKQSKRNQLGSIGTLTWQIADSHIDTTVIHDFLCLAYGASRRVGDHVAPSIAGNSLLSIFRDDASFQNIAQALYLVESEALRNRPGFEFLRKGLDDLIKEGKLLPGINDYKVETSTLLELSAYFHTEFGWVEFDSLSLGYKTLMAWVVDFAIKMAYFHQDSPHPLAEPAICLVDEIDLHMHPKWQRSIMDELTRTFPNTQFIVTAHSPLVVQASGGANLVLLRKEGDQVVVVQEELDVEYWRVDQILESEVFGEVSTYGNLLQDWLAKHERLLMKEKLSAKEKSELKEIEEKLDRMPISGKLRDREALAVIRKAAERLKNGQP